MKKGIDLSEWQSHVDYNAVIESGIEFAIIRVGYGVSYDPSQRDSEFDNHYSGFKGRIPLGAYYYAYATDYDSGRKEAENCLAYMGDKSFELPIFYDMEENRNTYDAARGFIDRIREAGLKAGFYTFTSMYIDKGLEGIDCDCLWLAEFGANDGNVPSVPPRFDYNIWQYTSKGYVPGVDGNADLNLMKDDTPTPTPQPTPPSPTPSGDEEIRNIQNWVNSYGFGIAVDGYFGPETKKGLVKVYQTELNKQYGAELTVDGVFGYYTRKATPIFGVGAKGNITKCIQSILYCYGYPFGKYGIDGVYGEETETNIYNFQREHGLSADGIFGPDTANGLFA